MRKKRIRCNGCKPGKNSRPVLDAQVVRLAAALEAIAAMDALPLASAPPGKRRRRCAT
jgi:hypothetical protein